MGIQVAAGREQCLARGDGPDPGEQFVVFRVLAEQAFGSGKQRPREILVERERGGDQEAVVRANRSTASTVVSPRSMPI